MQLAKQQSEEFEKRDQASCVGLDQSRAAFSDARDKSVAFETALASETSSLQAAHAVSALRLPSCLRLTTFCTGTKLGATCNTSSQ